MSILKNSNKFKKGKFENIEIEFNLEENSTFNDSSLVKNLMKYMMAPFVILLKIKPHHILIIRSEPKRSS